MPDLEKLVRMAEKKADSAEVFHEISKRLIYKTVLDKTESFDSHEGASYALRVVKDRRAGFSFFAREKDFPCALESALSSAKYSSYGIEFPGKEKAGKADCYSGKLSKFSKNFADETIAMLGVAGKAHSTQNMCAYEESTSSIANSSGVSFSEKSNAMEVASAFQLGDCVSGYSVVSTERIIPSDVAKKSMNYAEKFSGGKRLEGEFDIILSPNVVSEFIIDLLIPAVHGGDAFRKRSPFSGKLGKMIASEDFSLYDDPFLKGGVASRTLDDEGVAGERRQIIGNGELKSFLYDLKSAFIAGKKPTGNGARMSPYALPTVMPSNVVAASKNTVSFEDIDGIFIHEVIGMHNANGTTGDFSLEIANAATLRNGELEKPVANCSLAGNFFDVLKNMSLCDDFQKESFYAGPSWTYRGRIV